MLVVVHNGDVQFFLQTTFYLETLGSLNVFQIDASESGGNGFYGFNELVRVFLVHFYVEDIYSAVNLEQQSFSFHYRFACHSAYVAQSQYRCSVGNDGHQIAFGSILISVLRILFYFQTGFCHTGRVGQ